jgi:hypothetical protein
MPQELSLEEVLAVVRSEAAAVSERRLLRRLAAVMGTLLLLTVAATCGLTYAVVALSKDTAVAGGALVSKDSGAPLATGQVTTMAGLARLWQGATDAELVQLEAVVRSAPGGAKLVDRVASAVVVPGEYALVTTATPGLAFRITAEGVALAAAAGGGAGAGGAGAGAAPAGEGAPAAGAGRRLAISTAVCQCYKNYWLGGACPATYVRYDNSVATCTNCCEPACTYRNKPAASGGACPAGTPEGKCCDPTCAVYRDKNLANGGVCATGTPDQCCDPLCPCLANRFGKCGRCLGACCSADGTTAT